MTIVDFLLARIREDEAEAAEREAMAGGGGWTPEHAERHRGEAEAKRRILNVHGTRIAGKGANEPGPGAIRCATCTPGHPYPCRTLRAIALPYVGHPDFDDEWAAG